MNEQLNTGYVQKPHLPEHEEKLGDVWASLTDGHWLSYSSPTDVQQNIGVESEACTSFGLLDALEPLLRKQYGDTTEWSARFLAWASGTTATGNDPMTVADALANKGTVPEQDWPNTAALTNWSEFYSTPPQAIEIEAQEWRDKYFLGKRWIATDPASLMAGLQISPLGVAGYAWAQDSNGLYYTPSGAQPCHWFALIDFVEGEYWVAFDSYANDIKHLRWDYVFGEAMQYRVTTQIVNQSAWQQFLTFIQSVIGSFKSAVGNAVWPTSGNTVYQAAVQNLGREIYYQLDHTVPAVDGCAASVSYVLKEAGYNIPQGGIPTVNGLIDWMLANGFSEAPEGSVGAIVTAHSPNHDNPQYAHTGVVGKYGVMSNTSFPVAGFTAGEWAENYPGNAFQRSFTRQGSVIRYFVPPVVA